MQNQVQMSAAARQAMIGRAIATQRAAWKAYRLAIALNRRESADQLRATWEDALARERHVKAHVAVLRALSAVA